MPKTLQNYINKNNLKDSIGSFRVVQGTAKNTGSIYYCVEIEFINGFSKRLFLNDAESFAIMNSFEQLEAEETFDD